MAYRGLERNGPACYRHEAAAASETCSVCLEPICEICVGFENTQPHCPPCALRARRIRRLGRAFSAGLGVVVALTGILGTGWLLTRENASECSVEVGRASVELANVLEQQGKFCEAMTPLNEILLQHPNVTTRAQIEARLDRLSELCAPQESVQK